MLTKNHSEPFLVQIIRIITGIVFLFSAYVKGVDPMGTDYRVIDYLEAYGWYGALDYSFLLTIIVISAEFLLGISIILRLKPRLASLGLLLIMVFFTIVTFFDKTISTILKASFMPLLNTLFTFQLLIL